MAEKYFPRFWFEGNHAFMWVNNLEELQQVFDLYEGIMTPDEILDKAVNIAGDDFKEFGLRIEHDGKTSLRKHLKMFDIEVE